MDRTYFNAGALALATLAGCSHAMPRAQTAAARTHGEGFALPILALSAAGRHVCAVDFADPVQCMHIDGEDTVAMDVPGTEGAIDVVVAEARACALFGSGRVACFGWNGAAPTTARLVTGVEDAFEIAVGRDLVCARSERGTVRCAREDVAFDVEGVEGAVEIALDDTHGCARTARGDVSCWTAADPVGRAVAGIHDATTLAGGPGGLYATTSHGELVRIAQWGRPEWMFGSVVAQMAGTRDLVAGASAVCGATTRGEAVCWSAASRTPRIAARLDGTHDLAVGSRFACGIAGDGDMRCASLGPDAARATPRLAVVSAR